VAKSEEQVRAESAMLLREYRRRLQSPKYPVSDKAVVLWRYKLCQEGVYHPRDFLTGNVRETAVTAGLPDEGENLKVFERRPMSSARGVW